MTAFKFFSDPGHGWLRVDLANIRSAGLEPSSFSEYSYAYSHWLYLEEDQDAAIFLNAYHKKRGQAAPIKYSHTNRASTIRNYPRNAVKEKVSA